MRSRSKYKAFGLLVVAIMSIVTVTGALPMLFNQNGQDPENIDSGIAQIYEHNGQSEAFAPTLIGGAELAGQAGLIDDKYQPTEYFDFAEDTVDYSLQDASNDTRRQGIHSAATVADGANEAYLDNFENDQITLEGQVEQVISQKLIQEGNSITSETQTVNIADKVAKNYIQGRINNSIETRNFAVQSNRFYLRQLEKAGYGDDVIIGQKGRQFIGKSTDGYEVRDSSDQIIDDYTSAPDSINRIDVTDDSRVVTAALDGTIEVIDTATGSVTTHTYQNNRINGIQILDNNELLSLGVNGNLEKRDMTTGSPVWSYDIGNGGGDVVELPSGNILVGIGGGTKFKVINPADGSTVQDISISENFASHAIALQNGNFAIKDQNKAEFYDEQGNSQGSVTTSDTELITFKQLDNGTLVLGGSDGTVEIVDKSGTVLDSNAPSTSKISKLNILQNGDIAASNYATTWVFDDNLNVINTINVGGSASTVLPSDKAYGIGDPTFDPETIANKNANYASSSDVPNVSFTNSEGEEVDIVAEQISTSTEYTDGDRKIATAYNKLTGQPIKDGRSYFVRTTSSGVSDLAEPYEFDRSKQLIEETDSVADNVMSNKVVSYAKDLWQNYIKDVANDDTKDFYYDENITEELSQLTIDIDPDSPRSVIATYYGSYGSTLNPVQESVTLKNQANNNTTSGALFSTDISELVNDTNDTSVLAEGDVIDTTGVSRSFVVSHDDGQITDLAVNQTYGVTSLDDPADANETITSVDLRTFDFTDTNLSDQANRLDDLEKKLDFVEKEYGGGGGGGPIFGGDGNGIIDNIIPSLPNPSVPGLPLGWTDVALGVGVGYYLTREDEEEEDNRRN